MSKTLWIELPCGCRILNQARAYCEACVPGKEATPAPRSPARLPGLSPEVEAQQQLTCDLAALGGIVREEAAPLCIITIPVDAFATSENGLPTDRHVRAAVIKAARLVAYRAWQRAGSPRFDFPVVCRAVIRRGKATDQVNIVSSSGLKPLIDGVCVGMVSYARLPGGKRELIREPGMLPDDSARWLTLASAEQQVGSEWSGPAARVELSFWRREE